MASALQPKSKTGARPVVGAEPKIGALLLNSLAGEPLAPVPDTDKRRMLWRDPGMLALFAVIALAAAVRFATLGHQSFWEDGTVARWLLGRDLPGMLSTLPQTESTPPLYYVIAWAWSRVFGLGEPALRPLSALAGALTVLVAYALGRELASRRVGLAAALLVALSPDLVWYSQEARAYALFVLLTALTVLLCLRARRRARALAAWAAVAALALATHYFAAFLIAPEALWLFARPRNRGLVLAAAGVVVLVGAALLPLALAQHAGGGSEYLAQTPLRERIGQVPSEFIAGPPAPASWTPFIAAFAVCACAAVALLVRVGEGRERRGALVLAALALVAFAQPLVADVAGLHVFAERNTMDALVPLLVALACGLVARRAGWLGATALAALCGAFAWNIALTLADPGYQREDWRGAARALGSATRPRALVIAPVTNNPRPVPRIVGFDASYLPSVRAMPRRGARVAEIDVLDIRAVEWFDGPTPPAPRPPPPARGFRLTAAVNRSNFRLYRFTASHTVEVTSAQLQAQPLLPRSPSVMVGLQLP